MNREVRAPVEERFFDFFDEEALAADVAERPILDTVAGRDDLELARLEARRRGPKAFDERAALRESERGASRGVREGEGECPRLRAGIRSRPGEGRGRPSAVGRV